MLIFNRVAKCGTHSLQHLLANAADLTGVKWMEVHHQFSNSALAMFDDINAAVKSNVDLVMGHLPLGVLEYYLNALNRTTKTILVVRDPVDRAISHLSHWISNDRLYFDGKCIRDNRQPLRSFRDDFVDFQYKWLIGFFTGIGEQKGMCDEKEISTCQRV